MDKKAHRSRWTKVGDHWSHPCDSLKKFRYPIPVAADFSSGIAEVSTSLSYLEALTTTARLWCVQERASNHFSGYDMDLDLEEACSYAVANIYWSRKHESSFPIGTVQSDGESIGDSAAGKGKCYCDFVAISEGYAKDDDKDYFGRKRSFLRYVNVLWIEKVGGVFYRRGLGRVYKNAWLKCAKQENVVLG